jgi:hypothetical protein
MKKLYRGLILLFLLLAIPVFRSSAQKFDIDTLQYFGPTKEYINLVILGDGYTAEQLGQYSRNARTFTNYLFSQAPYNAYKNYFNVFAIQVISAESGVKHPKTAPDCDPWVPESNPRNFFGTTFDYGAMHRLVVPTNHNKMGSVLNAHIPDYDQVLLLANTPYYGGSGGTYATATLDSRSNEIALHEMGHSFAGLADEYWAGPSFAMEKPNLTRESDSTRVKWKNWLAPKASIGIFPHPDPQWYKPTDKACKMEFLDKQYCAVCTETIIERIHTLLRPIRSLSPDPAEAILTTPGSPSFFVSLKNILTSPNTLKSSWQLNGAPVPGNRDSVEIVPGKLQEGLNNLSVSVIDTTLLTRSDTHAIDHLYTVSWTLNHAPPLPVTWTSFKAAAGAAGVTLTWTTATEVNNDRFEVERSTNGLDWQVIGKVQGHGTSNTPQQYYFYDASGTPAHTPTLYYRLKQADIKGFYEYSSVQAVRTQPLATRVRLLGNPVAEQLHFELSGLLTTPLTLEVYNLEGSNVLALPVTIDQQSREINVPVAHLVPGVYIYSLLLDTEVLETGRFLKLKR